VTGTPRVAVLDYGIGNLRSAAKALERVGADARLTDSAADVDAADAVVLPGVGAFGACMESLRARGLEDVVHRACASGRPFLGICVGMQMLFSSSEEDPGVAGLGVIPGAVRFIDGDVVRPQMQWNRLDTVEGEPMFRGLAERPWMYFVHSLHGVPNDAAAVVATCRYGGAVNAAFRSKNVAAVQFHPEKSATSGLALLANFVASATGGR
jgi:glutamine amidotransferase